MINEDEKFLITVLAPVIGNIITAWILRPPRPKEKPPKHRNRSKRKC